VINNQKRHGLDVLDRSGLTHIWHLLNGRYIKALEIFQYKPEKQEAGDIVTYLWWNIVILLN
jgi:hypothetical protein